MCVSAGLCWTRFGLCGARLNYVPGKKRHRPTVKEASPDCKGGMRYYAGLGSAGLCGALQDSAGLCGALRDSASLGCFKKRHRPTVKEASSDCKGSICFFCGALRNSVGALRDSVGALRGLCGTMRRPALPCVTMRGSAAPCVALRGSASLCVALGGSALPCGALGGSAALCVALRGSAVGWLIPPGAPRFLSSPSDALKGQRHLKASAGLCSARLEYTPGKKKDIVRL
jgi:hypothetical protein